MITWIHALQVPLALAGGLAAGVLVRRRKHSLVEAYALALAPGLVIALATALFGPTPDEQAWQGLILWAAWSGVGVCSCLRGPRRSRITTLGLAGHERD